MVKIFRLTTSILVLPVSAFAFFLPQNVSASSYCYAETQCIVVSTTPHPALPNSHAIYTLNWNISPICNNNNVPIQNVIRHRVVPDDWSSANYLSLTETTYQYVLPNGPYEFSYKPDPSVANNVSITVPCVIPPPSNLSGVCSLSGTSAALSWTLPRGYSLSYLRVQDNSTGILERVIPEANPDNGPSFVYPTIPGRNYTWWVHTRVPDGGFSAEVYGNFTCNSAPNPPTISGPVSGNPSVNYFYNFLSGDLQGDQIRYGIDWDMDNIADEWLPAGVTYVNTGTSQSASHSWASLGTKVFQALTQDAPGLNSSWASHSINLVNACVPPTTGSIILSPASPLIGATYEVQCNYGGVNDYIAAPTNPPPGCTWPGSNGGHIGTTVTFACVAPNVAGNYNVSCQASNQPGFTNFCSQPAAVSATLAVRNLPVTGLCGSANKNYPAGSTGFGSDTICSSGNPSPASPAFPPAGGSTNWICLGLNRGSNSVQCTASRSQQLYTVTAIKTMGGNVKSTDNIINCGGTCSASYVQNSTVTLQAIPNSSYWKFSGWSGDCSGTNTMCTLNVNSNKSATAMFVPRPFNIQEF